MIKHVTNAMLVVNRMVNKVHLKPPASFLMVRHVVEHGKCNKENNMVQMAVVMVQPFSTNICFNSVRLLISVIDVLDK